MQLLSLRDGKLVLYQGATFSRAATARHRMNSGFSPCYGHPFPLCQFECGSQSRENVFCHNKNAYGERLLQSDRNVELLIDVLRSCVAEKKFRLHDFVIMPDHVHLLLTVDGKMTIEKAMQLIKGRFSYRLKKEFGYLGEV